MKKIAAFFIFLFLSGCANAAKIGQYRYYNIGSDKYLKYAAINAQLQNQRAINQRRNQRYLRAQAAAKIRYPDLNNPYPNIQRTKAYPINRYQRYSPQYYDNFIR